MAFAPFDIAALVNEIGHSGDLLAQGFNEAARKQCLAAARSLSYALETPLDSVLRLNYAEVLPARDYDVCKAILRMRNQIASASSGDSHWHRLEFV